MQLLSMRSIGFDLTGNGYPDEAASAMMGMFTTLSWIEQEPAVAAIEAGRVLWVFEVEHCADSSVDHVRVTLHRAIDADDDPDNNLTGEGRLIRVDAPTVAAVGTSQGEGGALVSQGAAQFPLSHLLEYAGDEGAVVWLEGIAVAIELEYSTAGISGRAGAGVSPELAEKMYYEYVSRTATRIMAEDPGCPDACETTQASTISREMDFNGDGVVDEEELRESPRWRWYANEIDLLAEHDGEIVYWPGHDGIDDSVGIAMLFWAVLVTLLR
jgi:hypothetical protein